MNIHGETDACSNSSTGKIAVGDHNPYPAVCAPQVRWFFQMMFLGIFSPFVYPDTGKPRESGWLDLLQNPIPVPKIQDLWGSPMLPCSTRGQDPLRQRHLLLWWQPWSWSGRDLDLAMLKWWFHAVGKGVGKCWKHILVFWNGIPACL